MVEEKERGELNIDYSLEEVVEILKMPPLFKAVSLGEVVLERSERNKFPVIKKGYTESLRRVVACEGKKVPLVFRSFLRRYNSYFGKDIYPLLDDLDDESVVYIVGSLRFEENLRTYRHFLSKPVVDLDH